MTLTLSSYLASILPKAKARRIPLSGQFEITPRCNLACKMCYIANPGSDYNPASQELSAADWIRLAEEAREAGMINLLLTGGEVFMRKDFRELYEALKGMGFLIKIYSNGTLIDSETAAWLGSIKPFQVEITLYGASAETYGKVTGHPEAFSKAISGIDCLLKEGIPLKLRTTVVRDNYRDFDEIARIAEERELKWGVVNYIMPVRKDTGRMSETYRLPPDLQIEYETGVEEYFAGKQEDSRQSLDFEEFSNDPYAAAPDEQLNAYKCLAGKTAFWITWRGEMTPCSSIDETGIYPLRSGFQTAWDGLKNFCDLTPVCEECVQCIYREKCMTCPARLKLETGSFDIKSSYLCELAKRKSSIGL
ncbi:MAG TPA: radical SAM protein [Syntrophomonadaceae bacterium]|nr:radical SAM protein [Syntrophomonadaceae bacterium]